jgi:hypothetical protein
MKKIFFIFFVTSALACQINVTDIFAQSSRETQQNGSTLGTILQTIQSIFNVINASGGQSQTAPQTSEKSGEQAGLLDTLTAEAQKLLSTMTVKEKEQSDIFGSVRSILNATNEKISESQVVALA